MLLTAIAASLHFTVSFGAAPPLEQLRLVSHKLKAAAMAVEGKFTIRRVERAIRGSLQDLHNIESIPVKSSGQLWRYGEQFRADYLQFQDDPLLGGLSRTQRRVTIAISNGQIFSLVEGSTENLGSLDIYPAGSEGFSNELRSVDLTFRKPIDIGWRPSGYETALLLERPTIQVKDHGCDNRPNGFSLVESSQSENSRSEACFSFAEEEPFLVQTVRSVSSAGEMNAIAEMAITWKQDGDDSLPIQVIERLDLGEGNGYTCVTELTLVKKELSDIPSSVQDLSSDSFKNAGFGFTVYRHAQFENVMPKLESRHWAPTTPLALMNQQSSSLMWIAAAILALLAVVLGFGLRKLSRK